MAVLINFKICDNAKDCSGIAVCPTGALSWDAKKKSIKIDNTKCISCRRCEKACMTDSIYVAKDEKEYKKIEKKIKDDRRKMSDLFVDRYGAQPVSPANRLRKEDFKKHILEYDKLSAVEIYDNDSIMCLLKSIPIKRLLGPWQIRYRKTKVNKELKKAYKLKKLPALLFFQGGKLLGKIEGFFDNKKEKEMVGKIKKIFA